MTNAVHTIDHTVGRLLAPSGACRIVPKPNTHSPRTAMSTRKSNAACVMSTPRVGGELDSLRRAHPTTPAATAECQAARRSVAGTPSLAWREGERVQREGEGTPVAMHGARPLSLVPRKGPGTRPWRGPGAEPLAAGGICRLKRPPRGTDAARRLCGCGPLTGTRSLTHQEITPLSTTPLPSHLLWPMLERLLRDPGGRVGAADGRSSHGL